MYPWSADRLVHTIAESDQNDVRLIRAPECGGYGLDAVWADDFHHSVHTLLTGERDGYYADFGEADHLAEIGVVAVAFPSQQRMRCDARPDRNRRIQARGSVGSLQSLSAMVSARYPLRTPASWCRAPKSDRLHRTINRRPSDKVASARCRRQIAAWPPLRHAFPKICRSVK